MLGAGTNNKRGLARWLPAVAAGALIAAAGVIGGFSSAPVPGLDGYFEAVGASIDNIPYKVGPWVGQDAPVQPSAIELLAPNRLLSRNYLDPESGSRLTLLIVHCGDARDMDGHFPPICYPANGWDLLSQRDGEIETETGVIPVTRYAFDRDESGVTFEREVVSFFALPNPDLPLTRDRGAVGQASRSSARSGLGAAQIQLLLPRAMPEADRRAAEREFASALRPVLGVVTSGVKPRASTGVQEDG